MGGRLQGLRGHSLIELMIVLAIAAIGLGLASPSLRDLGAATAGRGAANQLMLSLNQARQTAVYRGSNVGLCPSADGLNCSESRHWHQGWILFEDRDGNDQPDEASHIVATGAPLAGVAVTSTQGRMRLRYQPDGTSPGSNVSFTLCDARGPAKASSIVVSNAGRPRRATADAQQAAQTCALLGGG